ncbi:MAG TPA: hypothetical protein VI298_00540 [Geobacteraceae bacterium]
MEIPLILCLIIVSAAIVLPHLSTAGRKIVISIASVPVLSAAFYMIVTPGWMPGRKRFPGPLLRWLVFLLVAAAIVVIVVAIDLA